ncbi:protein shisa-4-like [Mantella aurantiaca]
MDQTFKMFAFLSLMCITIVMADDCAPYVDANFAFQRGQTCILSFCAGSCTNRYCSIIPGTMLDQSQILCILNNLYFVIGAGIVVVLVFVAGVITCCCKSLCLCCSLCTPQRKCQSYNIKLLIDYMC